MKIKDLSIEQLEKLLALKSRQLGTTIVIEYIITELIRKTIFEKQKPQKNF